METLGAYVGADNFNTSPKRSFDQERYIGRQVKTQKDFFFDPTLAPSHGEY